MKVINRVCIVMILAALYVFVANWIFNHVNAFLGIGLALLGAYLILSKVVTTFQEESKNEEN